MANLPMDDTDSDVSMAEIVCQIRTQLSDLKASMSVSNDIVGNIR